MFTRPARLVSLLALPGLVLAVSPMRAQDPAQGQEEQSYQGEAPDRYAMVRSVEGVVRIHKGEADEDLSRGTPVAEGDVVESRGRGVLQLGDGTRVAFGGDTRFTVGGLFTGKDGEKQILLRLDYGRLRVKMEGEGQTRFRIDTPSGSATCLDRGTFDVESDRDGGTRVRVQDGRVRFSNAREETKLSAGEQLAVYGAQDRLDRVRDYNTYDVDDFDRWSDRAWVVRRGRSWDYIPPELRYYSEGLDDNGEWVNSGEYGWVWRPTGVAEDWRPYSAGRWGCYPGGLTWVSSEPWGYATYHHGRWNWSAGIGWCWIPGVYYSPAWVAWNNFDGYCGWAPLGYYNTPCTWGYGAWGGGYCWNAVPYGRINVININNYYVADRRVISGLGTGTTTWTGAGGRRGAPWRTGPIFASGSEFRGGQIQRAMQTDVTRQRMDHYVRTAQESTGRTVAFRRDPAVITGNGGGVSNRMIPFETRDRGGAGGERSETGATTPTRIDRGQPQGNGGVRPVDRGGARGVDRTTPRDFQNRPQGGTENRPQGGGNVVRPQRGMEDRPQRGTEDRPPRSFDREDRPRRDAEPRPQRDMESRPSPRPMEDRPMRSEPAPRREMESRPAPPRSEAAPQRSAPAPRQESHPAPARSEPSKPETPRGHNR